MLPESIRPSARLAALLGAGVVAFETCAAVASSVLLPAEAQDLARAAPKRLAEFAAGRACARAALAQLQITDFALRVGADRAPLWPAGIVGSITHTAGFCAVAVAPAAQALALGIDAEARNAVSPRLWHHICTAAELEALAALQPAAAGDLATLIFSAKEAFYKCQYPLTRQWLNFSDVNVSMGTDCFEVQPCRPLQLAQIRSPPWAGRFLREPDLMLTALCLP